MQYMMCVQQHLGVGAGGPLNFGKLALCRTIYTNRSSTFPHASNIRKPGWLHQESQQQACFGVKKIRELKPSVTQRPQHLGLDYQTYTMSLVALP